MSSLTLSASGGAAEAMAATSHPLATQAAIAVLRRGGNAVDAAVCAAVTLAVVEPQASGLGGDCFAMIVPGGDVRRLVAYNGSGRAPAAADATRLAERGMTTIEPHSADAVTVPGAVEAWARLVADHGRRELAELVAPAVSLAEDGCRVTPAVAAAWGRAAGRLRTDETARRVLLPGGRAPHAGERCVQPELATTLRAIAAYGRDGFYGGAVAADLVGMLRARGGGHELDDFATAAGEYVDPLCVTYRERLHVWECPPNGQGVAALELLRILEGFDAAAWGPLDAQRLHVLAEASRLVLGDRDALVADPAHAGGAVATLLDERRVARLRDTIDPNHVTARPPPWGPSHPDTTQISVVDGERTAVSLISSIFHPFGSGLMGPRSGVLLHNRGCGFVLEPGHPNRLGPGKRPLHTIIPAVASVPGEALLVLGVTGADYQPTGHAYVLGNLIDHGLDLQAAIDLPRMQALPGELICEAQIFDWSAAALRARGHRVTRATEPIGSAQIVAIDERRGVLHGAADPRRDGSVLGY